MVLATDMAKHFDDVNKLKSLGQDDAFMSGAKSEDDKIFMMDITVHMSDLSNPTKDWLLSVKWGLLLFDEFFQQGDTEKKLGLPIGMLTDRTKVNIAKS